MYTDTGASVTSSVIVDNTTENVNATTTTQTPAPANDLNDEFYPSTPIVGGGGGDEFDDKDVDKIQAAALIGIRVKTVPGLVIHGLQCIYKFRGEVFDGPYHGDTSELKTQTFMLNPGEHIVSFRARTQIYVAAIQFITNTGRYSPFYGDDLPVFALFEGPDYTIKPEDVRGGLQWISGSTLIGGGSITSFTAWWTKKVLE